MHHTGRWPGDLRMPRVCPLSIGEGNAAISETISKTPLFERVLHQKGKRFLDFTAESLWWLRKAIGLQ